MLAITLALATLAQPAPLIRCEGHDTNLATFLEMTKILFNQRQADRAGEFYAPEIINHNSDAGDAGTMKVPVERAAAMWRMYQQLEPDRQVINNVIICNGDLITAQTTVRGSRAGDTLPGKPAGRRHYNTTAIDIYRIKDGKVVERWGNYDMVTRVRQLGMDLDLSPITLPAED